MLALSASYTPGATTMPRPRSASFSPLASPFGLVPAIVGHASFAAFSGSTVLYYDCKTTRKRAAAAQAQEGQ
jgi:hypothetical protein